MKKVSKRNAGTAMTERQRRQLRELAKVPDKAIDLSDAPELPRSAWENAMRGKLYRPIKQAVSLRLDADVLAWLKKGGGKYQTRVNQMLRERMLKDCGLL